MSRKQTMPVKPFQGKTRYVIIRRVSKGIQVEKDLSLPAQERAQREGVAQEDGVIVASLEDGGVTGAEDDRDALQEAVRLARAGAFDVLLVWKSDRIFRDRLHAVTYKHLFRKHGVVVRSVTEPFIGGTTDSEKLLEGILEVFAEFFLDNLKSEIRKGHREIAEGKGRQVSFPPYGYRLAEPNIKGSQWDVDVEAALWIGWIFCKAREGMGLTDIARALNEAQVKTYYSASAVAARPRSAYLADGKSPKVGQGIWRPSTIRIILRNRVYLGQIKYLGDFFPGAHEAITDPITFDAVQLLLDRRGKGRVEQSQWGLLVGGLLRCPHCNFPMHFNHGISRTARDARAKGIDTAGWSEERLYADTYSCSNYKRHYNARRFHGDVQHDYAPDGSDCPGFNVAENVVRRLLNASLTRLALLAGSLPARPRPAPVSPEHELPRHDLGHPDDMDSIDTRPGPIRDRRYWAAKEKDRQKKERALLTGELDGLPRLRRGYQDQQAAGLMTLNELREALGGLEKRAAALSDMLTELDTGRDAEKGELTAAEAATLQAVLQDASLTTPQKRDALRMAVRHIVVTEDKTQAILHI